MTVQLTSQETSILDEAHEVARSRVGVCTYSELNRRRKLGLDFDNPNDRNQLSIWLRHVCEHELAHGRPAVVAVFVRAEDGRPGMPGRGFFEMVDDLDLRRVGEDDYAVFFRLLTEARTFHRQVARSDG